MLSLTALVDAFANAPLAVAGDAVLDVWLSGPSHRLCREAPVPVVTVEQRQSAPGGAANTAANAAALGAAVRFVGAIGDDPDGAALTAALAAYGASVDDVVSVANRRTHAKRRLLAGEQMLARFDECDRGPLPDTTRRALRDAVVAAGEACGALLVGDYGLGSCDDAMRAQLGRRSDRDLLLVVDAHDLRPWREARPSAVTPNWDEVVALLSTPPAADEDRVSYVRNNAATLHEATGARLVAVTLDDAGAVLLEEGRPAYRAYAAPVPHAQTAGAGDSFAAAFTLALAAGADPTTALEIGVAAASVVIREPGTGVCDVLALRRSLGLAERALATPGELATAVAAHRRAGRRIVFTNGCFDVLHRGHVAYLNEAKRLGDVLVVALNGDASVRRLKGPDRPVNPVEDRAAVLAALSCVDHLAVFDEDSPTELLTLVRPDLYVKGGDYSPETLPEASLVHRLGGEVRILDYLEDRSTSQLLERIRGAAS